MLVHFNQSLKSARIGVEGSRETFAELGERLARTLDADAGCLEALVEVDKHRVLSARSITAGGALLQVSALAGGITASAPRRPGRLRRGNRSGGRRCQSPLRDR